MDAVPVFAVLLVFMITVLTALGYALQRLTETPTSSREPSGPVQRCSQCHREIDIGWSHCPACGMVRVDATRTDASASPGSRSSPIDIVNGRIRRIRRIMRVITLHRIIAICGLLVLVTALALVGQTNTPRAQPPLSDDVLNQVGVDQQMNAQVPLDLSFRDEAGAPVRLGEYFGAKPVILTLNYYTCPNLCSLVLDGLVKSLRELTFDVGNQFAIVTVSIDPRDTPALATGKKATYLERYGRPNAAAGWHFLTGDQAAVTQLAKAVGFRYAYDARLDQYAHAAAIVVLTPQGKIARYVYGIEYAPRDLRLGLVEASEGKIGSAIDQFLLRCYRYDPVTGQYTIVVMTIVRLASAATVGILGFFVVRQLHRGRQRQVVS